MVKVKKNTAKVDKCALSGFYKDLSPFQKPFKQDWDKWYNSETYKQCKKEEDQLKCDPHFLSALEDLRTAHPLGMGALHGCRYMFFKNKVDKSAWIEFCEERRLQLKPLMWGNIQKMCPAPLSMYIDSSGNVIRKSHRHPSARQKRDFLPIERLYERLAYGERSKAPRGTLSTKYVDSKKRTKAIHRYAYNEFKKQHSAYKDHWPPIPKKKIIANVQSSIANKFGKKYTPSYVSRIVGSPPK